MSIEKPERGMLVIQCDACEDHIDFNADEGQPTDDMVACLKLAKEQGWVSQKPVGFQWEQYCEECAKLSDVNRRPKPRT
jgi:hypothetical protein